MRLRNSQQGKYATVQEPCQLYVPLYFKVTQVPAKIQEETICKTKALRQDKMEQFTVQDAAIPLRFCPNSNDLLYPKEDKVNKRLIYFCRNCEYTTPAVDFCVHRRRIFHSASEITAIIHDVRTDPTLPRSKDVRCVVCDHGEAVFFSQTTAEGMSLFFQCVGCGHKWKDTGLAT